MDRSAVDVAVLAALAADPALRALLPDGVWYHMAPQGRTRFAIVEQIAADVTRMFHGDAFEGFTYLVKAVTKDNSAATADAAAARIDVVVQAIATVAGYDVAIAQVAERMPPYNEPDAANPDQLWQHRGGLYEIVVSPA